MQKIKLLKICIGYSLKFELIDKAINNLCKNGIVMENLENR